MNKLTNKIAVITGGGSGIGLSTAQLFAEEGAKVIITGRNPEKLKKAILECKGLSVTGISCDVSKVFEIEKLYQKVAEMYGHIDILVANAGVFDLKPLEETDEEFFDRIVNINYKGLFFTVQKAINYLTQNSSIILLSSGAINWPRPKLSVYTSSKAAVHMLAKNFAADLVSRGIRVNSITPGRVKTPILDSYTEEEIENTAKKIPMGRMGTPLEIGKAMLFLASDDSSYMNGSDLVVDGGLTQFSN